MTIPLLIDNNIFLGRGLKRRLLLLNKQVLIRSTIIPELSRPYRVETRCTTVDREEYVNLESTPPCDVREGRRSSGRIRKV